MDYEKKYKESMAKMSIFLAKHDGFTISKDGEMYKEISEIFPELKESEDESIRKWLVALIKSNEYGSVSKVGEMPCPKLKVLSWLEKQGEQKPADKVEPKFKVGDWVVRNGETLQISGIDTVSDGTFHYWFTKGTWLSSKKMGNAMLWTIQDAKDGDVLVCPLPKGYESGEQVFIFKSINNRDYVDDCIEYYCRVYEGVFYENENGYMGTTSSPVYPATKEQRDTLEKAMADSGYEWDADKRELKKIENEIEIPFGAKDSELQEATYYIPKGFHAEIEGNNVIIKKGEQKPVWGEEDIYKIEDALFRTYAVDVAIRLLSKIKSIRPQNRWKPNDEQIACLHDAVARYNQEGFSAATLTSLLEQLKKLREE